jgi:hypothetical protein
LVGLPRGIREGIEEVIMAAKPVEKPESPAHAGGSDKLPKHPVIRAIDPEPFDRRQFVTIVGYAGEVTDKFVQVYPQLDLGMYLRIPRDAIVPFYESVNPSHESSPTKFLVKADASLEAVKVVTGAMAAHFVAGSIAASNLGGARPSMAPAVQTLSLPATSVDPCSGQALAVGVPPPSKCPMCPITDM